MEIVFLNPAYANLLSGYHEHLLRHSDESLVESFPFMPFLGSSKRRPKGAAVENLSLTVDQVGWQRLWLLISNEQHVVGHIMLRGSQLESALHRCQLSIGLEVNWRRQGWGGKLLDVALNFAKHQHSLVWVELSTFAHNVPARKLYLGRGFKEVGRITDCFRLEGGRQVEDICMTLRIR